MQSGCWGRLFPPQAPEAGSDWAPSGLASLAASTVLVHAAQSLQGAPLAEPQLGACACPGRAVEALGCVWRVQYSQREKPAHWAPSHGLPPVLEVGIVAPNIPTALLSNSSELN